jgi:hypothetical protein
MALVGLRANSSSYRNLDMLNKLAEIVVHGASCDLYECSCQSLIDKLIAVTGLDGHQILRWWDLQSDL